MRYLQGGEDSDCKDGKCDADGEHHKPSCPAAHEPGCSVRGADQCDCNTHTCGGDFNTSEKVKVEEKEPCTCRKDAAESNKTPNVAVSSSSSSGGGGGGAEKEAKDTLHLASVANLSLTRETNVTSVASTSLPTIDTNSLYKAENVFTSTKFRSGFESPASQTAATATPPPRVFISPDFSNVTPNSSSVSMLSHFPGS